MRTTFSLAILLAIMAIMSPGTARAAAPLQPPAFTEAAVPDDELALQRGTSAGPATTLNPATLNAVIDADVRAWFHATGGISGVAIDIWWSSTGTDMIVANVRSYD